MRRCNALCAPSRSGRTSSMDDTITTLLASVRAEPQADDLEVMRLSMLDWLAVGLAGCNEPVARITRAMVLAEGGNAQATLMGGGQAPARAAALVNGATSHALDYDDTHFAHIGHPAVAVIPAALAMGEREDAPRDKVLRAALAGCEASVRIGLLLGRGHYQAGFHQTATAGTFGATIAAGLLAGLNDERMQHALGLAATRASGLKSQFGTMGKPYNAGMAAANGLECADLAALGMMSNPDAVTGVQGFVPTHHGDGDSTETPGFLMRGVSHKFHACCHGLHAALEALSGLLPIDANKVSDVQVTTHPRWMSVCNKHAPETGLGAKFSYEAVMALALFGYDTADPATFADEPMREPAIRSLMRRVDVVTDEKLTETEAKVRIKAGEVFEAHHDLSAEMALEHRRARVKKKAAILLGDMQAEAAWDVIVSDGPVAALSALLKTSAPSR